MPQYIYSVARSPDDWSGATESLLWHYDRACAIRVEPEALATRASRSVWSVSGWDQAPPHYPALLARQLDDPPPQPDPPPPRARAVPEKRVRKAPRRPASQRKSVAFSPESLEMLDYLCEVYRLRKGQVLNRLISDAYRRDVVDAGLLAILSDDFGILSPRP